MPVRWRDTRFLALTDALDLRVNRLLGLLPDDELDGMRPSIEVLQLPVRTVVGRPGEQVEFVYLPLTAMLSIVGSDSTGAGVEMATVGREGLVGLAAAFGTGSTPATTVVQLPGTTARIPAGVFAAELARSESLRRIVDRYTAALLVQMGQGAVCNRLHELEARAARWLLATRDRVDSDEFPLTQQFLAIMLGVTRPKVTLASAALQRAGLIANPRNSFRILNREGLEAAACDCYAIIRNEFRRLLGT